MKLYSGPISLFTAKVRVALAEKGLAYDRVEVGWSLERRYEPHHPDAVALSPKRQVPVLVDGDAVIYDSTVILEYLEDRYPERSLYPSQPVERARCRQLEAAADEIVFESVWELIDAGFYPDARDPARLGAAQAKLAERHAWLDKQLAGGEYLCGEFSVADVGMFIMVAAGATLGAPPAGKLSNLARWMRATGERDAVREDQTKMLSFVATL